MNESERAASASSPQGADSKIWWGEFPIETGTWGRWQIGPLTLWAGRTEREWRIAHVRGEGPFRDEFLAEVPADLDRVPVPADAEQCRVADSRRHRTLELQPMLGDRPVVARPEIAFSIPPQERVSAFVSSAVWVRLSSGPQKDGLIEIPTWRPSDTWFGDNIDGFLCYATRTALRLEIDNLPQRPHRAVTPIVIDNQGKDTLKIDRISLPIPRLSLFVSPAGALWTERLHLTRREDAELAHVHVESDSPPQPGAMRLCGPREEVTEDNLLSRVFTGLFR